jgi:hypothetical protein
MSARKTSSRRARQTTLAEQDTTTSTDEAEPTPPAETVEAPAKPRDLTRCYVDRCRRPEVADDVGLCGAHYALRPDLRKVARHG